MNHIYEGRKDLSEHWMKDLTAKPMINELNQKIYSDTAWDHVHRTVNPLKNSRRDLKDHPTNNFESQRYSPLQPKS